MIKIDEFVINYQFILLYIHFVGMETLDYAV